MNFKKSFIIVGLAAVFCAMSFGSQVYAGGGVDPPPDWCTIQGPELWGVVILNNVANGGAALRVKRIKDCKVETFAGVEDPWQSDFPTDEDGPINWVFLNQSFFSDISGSAIITKVKNYQVDGNVISFDAQFQFCAP